MCTILDNITYYKCDVSQWDEVEAVSKQIVEEVHILVFSIPNTHRVDISWDIPLSSSTTPALYKESAFSI
jgi:hypothetical protein